MRRFEHRQVLSGQFADFAVIVRQWFAFCHIVLPFVGFTETNHPDAVSGFREAKDMQASVQIAKRYIADFIVILTLALSKVIFMALLCIQIT